MVLHRAHLLIAGQFQACAFRGVLALVIFYRLHGACQRRLGLIELLFPLFEYLQCQYFRFLEGTPKVLVGFQDDVLPVDLVLGVFRDFQVGLLDFIETVGDIAAGHLHPDIADAFERIQLAILDLFHHVLGIVAYAVERIGNALIAVAQFHTADLLSHHLVEQRGLIQRAGDSQRFVLVQVRYLVDQVDDRGLIRLFGHQIKVAQTVHGLVQVL